MKHLLHPIATGFICLVATASFAGNTSPAKTSNGNYPFQMFSSFMLTANGNMADGNRVVFDPQYSNAIDGNDAQKLNNPGENFGIMRDNKLLAIEARQPITTDTLFYKLTNLSIQLYKLMLVPEGLQATGANCELVDNFLHTRTTISLFDTTYISVGVTADPASKVSNRLMLVFGPIGGALPVTFSGINAVRVNNNIQIKWKVENELNILSYDVERSADAISFKALKNVTPASAYSVSAAYSIQDITSFDGATYYRVKATSVSGKVQYSPTVKYTDVANRSSIGIYQNPVINNTLELSFVHAESGTYQVRVTNMFGQPIYTTEMQVDGGDAVKPVVMNKRLQPGSYVCTISMNGRQLSSQKIIVQ